MGGVNLSDSDIEWLNAVFPNLLYDVNARRIVGELDFCACYDKISGGLRCGIFDHDDEIRESRFFLCDVFEVEICLDPESMRINGWPKVYEVGGRYREIAEKYNISIEDLHFYSDCDHACCLGIRYSFEKGINLKIFIEELVIPFFYRLAYVDIYGIVAARSDLWKEHSHGSKGHVEHALQMNQYRSAQSRRR